jgi:hypothetical protein
MNPRDIQKLLGGYATGILTDAEQQALFAAALDDQELFDALAREQSLRDLLRDPAGRAQLLASLDQGPARRWAWWPGAVAAALAGAAAVAILAVRINVRQPQPVEISDVRPPLAPPAPAPVGPLGVVPLPGTQARRPFLPPRMAKPARAPQLPEPPKVEMPNKEEAADLKGVIGGVPAAPLPPAPMSGVSAGAVEGTAAPALNRFAVAEARQLDVASTSSRPSAQMLFYGNQNRPVAIARLATGAGSAGAPVDHVGIRYTILRKQLGGNFAEIDPAELKTGDTIELRLTANTSGFLSIGGTAPVAISAMTPYTTPPLASGQQEVRVVFTRQQQQGATAGVQPIIEVQERATYVVNPTAGQSLSFVIRLQYK